jgi:arginase
MSGDLCLFFPQWQGSGPDTGLWAGAQALRRALPAVPFQEVAVSLEPVPAPVQGILGLEAILPQQREARRLIEEAAPDRIFSLGGDCGIEITPVSWLHRRYGEELAIVWLDAHGDLNSPDSSPSAHFHGMPLRFLLEPDAGPFQPIRFSRPRPSQVLLAGTRDLDAPESRFIRENAIQISGVHEIEADPSQPCRWALKRNLRKVYLHIDLDVLDPGAFPNLKCPAPGGLRLETLRSVIRHFQQDCQIVGFSIVEYLQGPDAMGPSKVGDLVQEYLGRC